MNFMNKIHCLKKWLIHKRFHPFNKFPLIGLIRHASQKRMQDCAQTVSKRSGKSKHVIILDMAISCLLFGSGYFDYRNYYFETLSLKQRNQYLTRGRYKKFLQRCHDKKYDPYLESKSCFSEFFREYMHREILDLSKSGYIEFEEFVKKHDTFFVKPDDDEGGNGIDRIEVTTDTNLKELFQTLLASKQYIVEEAIIQNEQMKAFHASSVNTLRIVTLAQDGWTEILAGVLRVGRGESVVDNQCSGGLAYGIEKESGIINTYGVDIDSVYHKKDNVLLGTQLIGWEAALEMCREAAKKIPQINMIGWDVAMTKSGPVLIEGNGYPGMDICQFTLPDGRRQGLWKRLEHYYRYSGKLMMWLMETREIPEKELEAYVAKKYSKYKNKYGRTINRETQDCFLRKAAMSVMIAEDHQRPWYQRAGENVIFLMTKIIRRNHRMTLGISQVPVSHLITNKKSIQLEIKILKTNDKEYKNKIECDEKIDRKEELKYLAHRYNRCLNYVDKVCRIYDCIEKMENSIDKEKNE